MKSNSDIFGKVLKTSRIEEYTCEEIKLKLESLLKNRVEQAYLFGSIARNNKGPYSDIDLILVVKTQKPFVERSLEFPELFELDMEMDILVYTPDEFKGLTENPTVGFWKSVVHEMKRIV